MRLFIIIILVSILAVFLIDCDQIKNDEPVLFKLHSSVQSGITFNNRLEYTEQLNPYTFRSFYNGGGVGLGDFNTDGLLDVFFAGNLVSNKLYINKGGFKFQDVTEVAGLSSSGVWTTGVSVVDINSDGLLDLYLCKSGPPQGNRRKNELFINNGNLTFSERAHEYGLDFEGLSIHAAFFDYDKDGDLDCYLLNNSLRSVGIFDLRKDQRMIPDLDGGNKLLKNENGHFIDISQSSGIYSSKIGFGLGVSVSDINNDSWPDLYVSNDFFEKDYLYINNQNGTFTESLEKHLGEISLGAMGADIADVNNDALPEIFVTEMLPENDERLKTTSQFESWDKYSLNVSNGYYRQFSRNTLQLNNGDNTFSEISRLAGTAATDWSWGALVFDMDNDGYKDIFVANGIYKDLINQDYVNFIADPNTVRQILAKEKEVIKRLVDSIPSNKIPNYAFKNNGDLTFTSKFKEWGFDLPTHSNGSAYGDLDNDGDLDIVLNNVNAEAMVYENQSEKYVKENATISISLHGDSSNRFAVGSKVHLFVGGNHYYQELSPMRGFMSSVDYRLHFGVGMASIVDSVQVEWPSGVSSLIKNVKVNQLIEVYQKEATVFQLPKRPAVKPLMHKVEIKGAQFVHKENDFSDFDRDRLLLSMISNEGPCLCVGDVNNDKLDDFYIGGAKGQAGGLFIQDGQGTFRSNHVELFIQDKESEDTDCAFFDANNDGRLDLYVTSGSNETSSSSSSLLDRLYFNKGNSKWEKSKQILPSASTFESTSTISVSDFDRDGDIDIFVGTRLVPFYYGLPANSYLLINNGKGEFEDVTNKIAPELMQLGMVTDSKWVDINGDQLDDLVVVGEWMPVGIFIQKDGKFVNKSDEYGFAKSNGWYHSVEVGDFNNDGMQDIVLGNHGLNSKFKASEQEPISMYVSDFDQNGTIEQVTTRFINGKPTPVVLKQDLVSQIPSLKKKYLKFDSYKGETIFEIFTSQQLEKAMVLNVFTLESAMWLNMGKSFKRKALPIKAQLAPVYSSLVVDINSDGNLDLLLGGNLYRAKPETGIYAASYGLLLLGDSNGEFTSLNSIQSGVSIRGEIRAMKKIKQKGKQVIVIGKNNDQLEFLTY